MNQSLESVKAYVTYYDFFLSQFLFDFITQKTFGFTCIVIMVYALVQKANHHSLLGAWFANIFGVFFHELAHALVGSFLYAKPNKFIIIPRVISIQNRSFYNLGRVEFDNLRWFNAFPTSLAPLLLLPFAYYLEMYYWNLAFVKHSLGWLFLYTYLQIVLIINSIPSIIDFNEAFKNPISAIFWVVLASFSLKYYNIIIAIFT
ncbi:hypothetical protein [Sulfurospirillum multivorans]|uniref:Uncharacterized protein n=2 Tax=Sulfurospirillum multivorans TaxID=66821 RepID=A0AA86DZY1_SULMK|nr:hypothetical protein [Sulfurospirillum multivorans]AHJ13005.1 hypothetical protein SMUL_1750 [Sulfurospirillum multivorans DSM 12446]QEH06496.1 hypothetical protein SMN_1731 [Sulfurospirillum multivorans]